MKTLQRQNLHLTDSPIVKVKTNSLVTSSGEEFPADVIVCVDEMGWLACFAFFSDNVHTLTLVQILAIGFALTQYDTSLQGRHGKTRDQHWAEYGCKATFQSVAMHDFPNFFFIMGPNSARLHTSTIFSVEWLVNE